jgi:hypothetical protein
MAMLSRGRIGRRLLPIIIVMAVLAMLVPTVSAYEAHLTNVKVRVEERLNVFKVVELASPEDITEAIESGIVFPSVPNPPTVTDPFNVPAHTCVVWHVILYFKNIHDYDMTNVVVTDHFNAELAGQAIGDGAVDVLIRQQSRGKSQKVSFQSQARITWYVTYVEGDVSDQASVDNSDVVPAGETAMLEMLVWTKLNPSGRQSYTSPGDYEMNSGPVGKWFNIPLGDEVSHQWSFDALPLSVTAYE